MSQFEVEKWIQNEYIFTNPSSQTILKLIAKKQGKKIISLQLQISSKLYADQITIEPAMFPNILEMIQKATQETRKTQIQKIPLKIEVETGGKQQKNQTFLSAPKKNIHERDAISQQNQEKVNIDFKANERNIVESKIQSFLPQKTIEKKQDTKSQPIESKKKGTDKKKKEIIAREEAEDELLRQMVLAKELRLKKAEEKGKIQEEQARIRKIEEAKQARIQAIQRVTTQTHNIKKILETTQSRLGKSQETMMSRLIQAQEIIDKIKGAIGVKLQELNSDIECFKPIFENHPSIKKEEIKISVSKGLIPDQLYKSSCDLIFRLKSAEARAEELKRYANTNSKPPIMGKPTENRIQGEIKIENKKFEQKKTEYDEPFF